MSRSRNQKHTPKAYETNFDKSDNFFALHMSVLMSPAFKDLSARAVRLYLYCRAQAYAEKKHPVPDDASTFTMNQSKWQGLYELYSEGNKRAFYKDMSELIYHGFIRCVSCGAISREKTVYQFSAKWKDWGTDKFKLTPEEKTKAMINQECREAKKKASVSPSP